MNTLNNAAIPMRIYSEQLGEKFVAVYIKPFPSDHKEWHKSTLIMYLEYTAYDYPCECKEKRTMGIKMKAVIDSYMTNRIKTDHAITKEELDVLNWKIEW